MKCLNCNHSQWIHINAGMGMCDANHCQCLKFEESLD